MRSLGDRGAPISSIVSAARKRIPSGRTEPARGEAVPGRLHPQAFRTDPLPPAGDRPQRRPMRYVRDDHTVRGADFGAFRNNAGSCRGMWANGAGR